MYLQDIKVVNCDLWSAKQVWEALQEMSPCRALPTLPPKGCSHGAGQCKEPLF